MPCVANNEGASCTLLFMFCLHVCPSSGVLIVGCGLCPSRRGYIRAASCSHPETGDLPLPLLQLFCRSDSEP